MLKQILNTFITRVFAVLQNTTTLDMICETWEELCTVLQSTAEEKCQQQLHSLSLKIAGVEEMGEVHELQHCSSESIEMIETSLHLQGQQIKRASMFYHRCRIICEESNDGSDYTEKPVNPYHAPNVLQYLLNNFMHIVPLWSGLFLNADVLAYDAQPEELLITRDTNCHVENWFKIVKKGHNAIQDRDTRGSVEEIALQFIRQSSSLQCRHKEVQKEKETC